MESALDIILRYDTYSWVLNRLSHLLIHFFVFDIKFLYLLYFNAPNIYLIKSAVTFPHTFFFFSIISHAFLHFVILFYFFPIECSLHSFIRYVIILFIFIHTFYWKFFFSFRLFCVSPRFSQRISLALFRNLWLWKKAIASSFSFPIFFHF